VAIRISKVLRFIVVLLGVSGRRGVRCPDVWLPMR
jgi:hypothetical protein